ncbi:growth arrest and DNA damage-inducible protein GADD45 gamma-like [Mytilus californianus]|uniref:growth arrest and DNA damage-inducible protein GADD45 gamma-like n=1 Tax=Mytilus californianus TaxID=6549 RepID=UPI00224654AC|nr:growth arrest and DNA damage-inducible protein GADD45 gamma-like [Mytilus californianus]
MTFPEEFDVLVDSNRNDVNNLGFALKEVLKKGQKEDRVVAGVYECAKILQNSPENVGLCLLQNKTEDVTVQIHQKLVEAFCWENDIEVIKVDCLKTVESVLSPTNIGDGSVEIDCVLIHNDTSDSIEEFINNYYAMLATQCTVVRIPD